MISGTFCVVSISSEPLLLWVVPDVFTAARKRLLGIEEIKFEVVSHLGVIVDYFSLLLVPSALRVPLSLSQVAGGVYMMFKGRGASSRLSQYGRWLVRCLEIFSLKKVVHSGIYWSMVMEEINQSSSACSPLQGRGLASVWHGYIYMSGWLLPEVNLWYSLNQGP